MFLQFLVNGLITGLIYSLAALGFAFVYNTTRIFHIAYAMLLVWGQYMIFYFNTTLKLNLYASVFFSVLLVSLISLAIELVLYRPLVKKQRPLNQIMITSLGAMIVLTNIIVWIWGGDTRVLNQSISQPIEAAGIIITHNQIIQLFGSILFLGITFALLKYSRLGLKMRAMRDDGMLFQLYGYDIMSMRTIIFLLSGMIAALTGALICIDVSITPYTGMTLLLNAVVALIIGGIGKFRSVIYGGIAIGVLQALTIWLLNPDWSVCVSFLVLLLFLIVKPGGILGKLQREA